MTLYKKKKIGLRRKSLVIAIQALYHSIILYQANQNIRTCQQVSLYSTCHLMPDTHTETITKNHTY